MSNRSYEILRALPGPKYDMQRDRSLSIEKLSAEKENWRGKSRSNSIVQLKKRRPSVFHLPALALKGKIINC